MVMKKQINISFCNVAHWGGDKPKYIHNEQGEEPIITDDTMNFVLFFFFLFFVFY